MRASEIPVEESPRQGVSALPPGGRPGWIGRVPLILLPFLAIALGASLRPWIFMWLLAASIYAGCKWVTWWQAKIAGFAVGNWKRSAAYLLFWPGMDSREFFDNPCAKCHVRTSECLAATAKTLTGATLIGAGARVISPGHPMLGGWSGMIGLALFLHFGTFHLVALAWQRVGLGVRPIMQKPLLSRSLSELWGKRWNLGFRFLSHTWVFQPLQKRFGLMVATMGAFLASGLLHDLVISVPARAGYGLPTAYFLVQRLGVVVERSEAGQSLGLGGGVRGWLWTAVIAAGPAYVLFHPWFVMRVIDPFLRAVAG